MDEVLELKAALGTLLEHMADQGHGGLYQHSDCQACIDTRRAYALLGVEYEFVEQLPAVSNISTFSVVA